MVPKKGFLTFLASAPSRSTAGQEVFSIGMCVKAAEIITFNLPGDPPPKGVLLKGFHMLEVLPLEFLWNEGLLFFFLCTEINHIQKKCLGLCPHLCVPSGWGT